jgi:hypothetical protein
MIGKPLILLLLACTLPLPAQDRISGGQVLLVRVGESETPLTLAGKDVSGIWKGAITIQTRSIPLCLVLGYNGGTLTGTIGPDPKHQNGWPVTAIDGMVRFSPGHRVGGPSYSGGQESGRRADIGLRRTRPPTCRCLTKRSASTGLYGS